MGKFFDRLTKTGLQDANGNTTFYDNPTQTALALAKNSKAPTLLPVLPKSLPLANDAPADAQAPLSYAQDASASGDLTPGGGAPEPATSPAVMKTAPQPAQPPAEFKEEGGYTPTIVKPSFQDVNVDAAGNQKRLTPNSGLTKLGALMSLLSGGIQGGSDALASGAMDWVPGRSNFGAGLKGAAEMPLVRAARARAITEQQLQQQHLGAETTELQARTEEEKKRGEMYGSYADYPRNVPNIEKQLTELYMAGKTDDDPEVKNLLRAYKFMHPEKPAPVERPVVPHTTSTGKGVYQLNPDTGRYDIYVGPPNREGRQPTEYEEWKGDPANKGKPITQYWKERAQATGEGRADSASLTPAQRAGIEANFSKGMQKLSGYKFNQQTSVWESPDGMTMLTPEQMQAQQDELASERQRAYLAGGETPPDVSAASGIPQPVSAHGANASNPYRRNDDNPYRRPQRSIFPRRASQSR